MTATATTTDTWVTSWEGARDFVLRIAGLPIECAERLRFPESTAWADAVIDAEAHLHAEGADLSDLLSDVVADPDLVDVRGKLIALRRDLHNNRYPRSAGVGVIDRCPPELVERIGAWLEQRERATALAATGPDILDGEFASRREALRRMAVHPRLRAGLILASPTVDSYLAGYLNAGATLNKRQRRLERTLLDYVYRVACKTSPFSSFTGLALGRVPQAGAPAVPEGLRVGHLDEQWGCSVQLNVALIGRLVEAVVGSELAFPDLAVALTPGFQEDAERVRFVRRSVTHGDDSATVSFDMATDDLFFIRRRETLAYLVDLLDGGKRLTAAQVVAALRYRTGEDDQACGNYVRHLLRIGLLWLPDLGADLHAPDPLADFGDQLRRLGHLEWARAAAEQVFALVALVQEYADSSDLARRRSILGELRVGLTEIFADLGREDESLPVTLLFEDTVATAEVVTPDAQTWEEHIIAPLSRLSEVVECFDYGLPSRLLMRGFFFLRYGRGGTCPDVIDFLHNFAEDIYDEFGRVSMRLPAYDADGRCTAYQNWLQVPELERVNAARAAVNERMHHLWAGYAGGGPVELPEDLIDEVRGWMTPIAGPVRPQGFFLQIGGHPEAPELVVNKPTPGLLFSYSRFTNTFGPELAERLRAYAREIGGDDIVLAEVTGGLNRTNLNVHQPLADYHIVCPAEGSSFPTDRRLPIEDLYVAHDEAADRLQLRSRRLGKEILPVYLGYLMPTALPEVARNLLLFSPAGLARLDLWGGIPQAEAVDGVRFRPQLRYRNVVLARSTWSVAAADLPVRVVGEPEATWLLRWRRWQRAHGIPDRVFVTYPASSASDDSGSVSATDAVADAAAGAGSDEADAPGGRRSKPSYVDFQSVFSLTLFAGEAQSTNGVIEMQEMLPTEDQLYVTSGEGRHMCEVALELVRRAQIEQVRA